MNGEILVAPFSNSDVRDWPSNRFAELVEILQGRLPDSTISLIGSASQFWRGAEIVRRFNSARVRNDCGRFEMAELTLRIRAAACVIGNNSGIAHLSGYSGVPTICVFGGSHSRIEWRPLGPWVRIVTRVLSCSPCHLPRACDCPFSLRCLWDIDAANVADAAIAVMEEAQMGSRPINSPNRCVDDFSSPDNAIL